MTTIQIYYKGEWKPIATFSGYVPPHALSYMASAIDNDPLIPHENVAIVCLPSDEVLWDARHAVEDYALECMEHMSDTDSGKGFDPYDYEPADIDSDMGFDPYMGCFSDDC